MFHDFSLFQFVHRLHLLFLFLIFCYTRPINTLLFVFIGGIEKRLFRVNFSMLLLYHDCVSLNSFLIRYTQFFDTLYTVFWYAIHSFLIRYNSKYPYKYWLLLYAKEQKTNIYKINKERGYFIASFFLFYFYWFKTINNFSDEP